MDAIEQVKTYLEGEFEMTDPGEVHWILGMGILYNQGRRELTLSQTQHMDICCITTNFPSSYYCSEAYLISKHFLPWGRYHFSQLRISFDEVSSKFYLWVVSQEKPFGY